jgi:integrase
MPNDVEPTHIAQFLEQCESTGAAVVGNRAKAALSSVYEFAMRKGWAKHNPCRGVRRNKERASTVYIESAALGSTIDRAPDHFARVMQLAYITGMRGVDLALLEVSAVTPKGLEYTESKTGKHVTMAWTDTLRVLVLVLVREILEARHERINRPYANQYKKPRAPQTHTPRSWSIDWVTRSPSAASSRICSASTPALPSATSGRRRRPTPATIAMCSATWASCASGIRAGASWW